MRKLIKPFVAVAVILVIFGTIYIVVQQQLRMVANDPQIQLAEDGAALLASGTGPGSIATGNVIIGKSLAPFVIVYDKSGHVVAGNGYLDGRVPTIPFGVLQAANNKQYNAVTWQPQDGIRIATVNVKAGDYYVLSGRSLAEVEAREQSALQGTMAGLLGALLIISGWNAYSMRKGLRPEA